MTVSMWPPICWNRLPVPCASLPRWQRPIPATFAPSKVATYSFEAKAGIGAWLSFYNEERQHQSLGYHTPRQIYQEGLWICGRSALPTGSAFPASRASSESGEMLAFAHIPTGATANKRIAIDNVRSRIVAPAVAQTAIGADIEIGRATP